VLQDLWLAHRAVLPARVYHSSHADKVDHSRWAAVLPAHVGLGHAWHSAMLACAVPLIYCSRSSSTSCCLAATAAACVLADVVRSRINAPGSAVASPGRTGQQQRLACCTAGRAGHYLCCGAMCALPSAQHHTIQEYTIQMPVSAVCCTKHCAVCCTKH
jgi:hypothetical protein